MVSNQNQGVRGTWVLRVVSAFCFRVFGVNAALFRMPCLFAVWGLLYRWRHIRILI